MGEVFLGALKDTLIVLPFLLIMNFIIELLEYKSNGLRMQKALKGGLAPLIGGSVGIIPQCGFSVVATELYAKRKIALGTLLAVYIATSDEALPIMLSNVSREPSIWTKIVSLILIKLVFALVVGYIAFAVQKLMQKRSSVVPTEQAATATEAHEHEHMHEHNEHEHDEHEHEHDDQDAHAHIHGCHHHALDGEDDFDAKTATKKQKAKRVFDLYFKHPLIHTATVIFFILIVNIVFGIIVYYVGEDRIAAFIGSTGYFQPVLAGIVGLIPNCAASVVITELYVVGGLSLGGAVAGLSVGAGIGYAVLVKQNKSVKNTVFIIVLMYVISVALGMIINAIPQSIFGL